MSDPKRMLSDPELGDLLRADLDVSAKHSIDYDVDKGLARHVALIAGGAAAATATVTATASASSLSTAATTATATTATATTAAATATTATATTAAATTAATGVAAGLGIKTMIAVTAIGVATATGGVIAVTSRPEPKPAAVTASQPSPVQTMDKASSPSRAKADTIPQTDMPNLEPTVTPDQLPIATPDKVAPATVSPMAEMDNYVKARGLAPTDPSAALALLDDGNRQFSRGVFVEEREALAIDCLVRLGRTAEAKQRGQTFLATHPTSTFAEKIRLQTDSH